MSGVEDVTRLAGEVTPWVVSAAGAYGAVVLTRGRDQAVDAAASATVGWGRRIAIRVFGLRQDGQETPEELTDVIDGPDDPDAIAVLRQKVKKVLLADPEFAAQVAEAVSSAGGGMTFHSYDESHQYNAPGGTININHPDQP